MSHLAIDPVTRLGGHLRIEAEVSGGAVVDAWVSGTMFRGIETALVGRDPREAWLLAERICGSCSGAHGLASVRAVEAALGVRVPPNARLLRNMIAGLAWLADQVTGFYQRSLLDWVDVAAAAGADPAAAAALAASTNPDAGDAEDGLRRVQAQIQPASRTGGVFASGAWGHPAFQLTPEADLVLVGHYLRALDLQRTLARAMTTLGGKYPHPQSFLVGGMTLTPPWGGPSPMVERGHPDLPDRAVPAALSSNGLNGLEALVSQIGAFVERVLVPDAVALARAYPTWATLGRGLGNYLAYGDFPEDDTPTPALLLPRGRLADGSLSRSYRVDEPDITEGVAHAWYVDGANASRPPSDGLTTARYDGPPPPVASFASSPRYTYVKSPRYAGILPMETGPLARMLVGYVQGSVAIRQAFDDVLSAAGLEQAGLLSTLGRLLARAAETQVIARRLSGWLADLRANVATGDIAVADLDHWHPAAWPREAAGFALGETSRGALGHWITIRDRQVAAYQVVDGSTWNASPRDAAGRRGPIEEALVGTPVADPDRPIEILRTVHAFDPCVACAAHLFDPAGGDALELRIRGTQP